MLAIFGKGKVGKGLKKLLDYLKIDNILMDDNDWSDNVLLKAESIIVSPGIKPSHKLYLEHGDKVVSELNFLGNVMDELKIRDRFEFIAVTGTNGKSTTVHVLYHLMKDLIRDRQVHLSGNFGTPLSETLLEIVKEENSVAKHLIILECSSFMLYGLKDFEFDYSILLNIARDHLDWHKDFQDYSESKINVLKFCKKYGVKDKTIEFDGDKNLEDYENELDLSKTNFLGEHNKGNLNSIYMIMRKYFEDHSLERDEERFLDVIGKIKPLEHRMSLLKVVSIGGKELQIYDDGICTSSQALGAALSSFDEKIVLIAGGYDKGDDYDILTESLKSRVRFMCLIGDVGRTKLKELCETNNIRYKLFESLKDVVNGALDIAKDEGINVVLFSPGAASFDMFQNVYDRCRQFEEIVEGL